MFHRIDQLAAQASHEIPLGRAVPIPADVADPPRSESARSRESTTSGRFFFSVSAIVVDVGGGHGALLAAILNANPRARGILFDRPDVVAGACPLLEAAGVASRCELVGGDFLGAVSSGGDLHLLQRIVHDWDDASAMAILSSCRLAMSERGRLLLIEQILPAGTASRSEEGLVAAQSDVNMLVLFGGKERTAVEYDGLLAAAGFGRATIIPTDTSYSVIEAQPI